MSQSAPTPGLPGGTEENEQEMAARLWARFSRFGWDILGVALLALAVLTLLGLFGLTRGAIINPWIYVLRLGLGWCSPLAAVALAMAGMLCFRRHFTGWPAVKIGRVIALELGAFLILALVSLLGGLSLERAEKGLDGGVIGWGLADLIDRLAPAPWSNAILLVLLMALAGYGFGLWQWGLRQVEDWLSRQGNAVPEEEPEAGETAPVEWQPEVEPELDKPVVPAARDVRLPGTRILLEELPAAPDEAQIRETGLKIEQTLAEFGIPVRVMGYRIGPTITQYAVEPGFIERNGPEGEAIQQKVRVAQISALGRDLALALSAERLRIEAPVPGRSFVGIEVPNPDNTVVRLRSIMESDAFLKITGPLAVALGKDVSGQPVAVDLARMPHMLIAGTTGSGKSVCIAALVTCLAMNNPPEKLRMALLDPKMVELARFNGLPHIFGKVETQVDRMLGVLRWALAEMDNRYRLLEDARARDIETYNRRMEKRGQPSLPRIVLVIDELADLMMSAPDQTEHGLVRLAQMARAVGIHLVVATQRPSTDVVTGLIKANFPARLAFSVASAVDSRVILDTNGAESLLGRGDMLFLNPEAGVPLRAQGVMVSDQEVERVIQHWKAQIPSAGAETPPWEEMIEEDGAENGDGLIEQAIEVVKQAGKASASLLQRRLRIGYPRAARLIDQLEEMGVVGPSVGSGKDREVLLDGDESPHDGEEDEAA